MINCRVEVTEELLEVLREIMLRRNKGRKMAAAAVTGILTLYFAWLALTVETERTLRSVLFAVFFVITVMLVLSMRGYFIDQRTKRMDRNLTSGYRIYHIDEDGIGFESQVGSGKDSWDVYRDWGEFRNYFYLKNIANQFVLIDEDALSEEEIRKLRRIFSERIG